MTKRAEKIGNKFKFFKYEVPGTKRYVRQPTSMSCWAAAYCMMRSWRYGANYTIEESLEAVPSSKPPKSRYMELYLKNQGLPVATSNEFVRDAKMRFQNMVNRLPESWERLLRTYGLLWVSMWPEAGKKGRHAFIICGIHGMRDKPEFSVFDSASPGRRRLEFWEFWRMHERAGGGEKNLGFGQVRHF